LAQRRNVQVEFAAGAAAKCRERLARSCVLRVLTNLFGVEVVNNKNRKILRRRSLTAELVGAGPIQACNSSTVIVPLPSVSTWRNTRLMRESSLHPRFTVSFPCLRIALLNSASSRLRSKCLNSLTKSCFPPAPYDAALVRRYIRHYRRYEASSLRVQV
jgi:hypothetical protein